MFMQFECGEGQHFYGGVNFITNVNGNCKVYAEVSLPDGVSEDYGYLTMKNAILEALKDVGFCDPVVFQYDFCEQALAMDALADTDVYLDIDIE